MAILRRLTGALPHCLAVQRAFCAVCALTFTIGGFTLAWLIPVGQMPDEWLHWESGLIRHESFFSRASGSLCSKQLDVPFYFGTERIRFDARAKIQPGLYEGASALQSRCATEHLGYGHRLTYFGIPAAQRMAFGRSDEARAVSAFYLTRMFHGIGVTSLLVALLWRTRGMVLPGLAMVFGLFLAPIMWQQSFAVSADPVVFMGTLACVHILLGRPGWGWSAALMAVVWSALATKVVYLPAFVGTALVPSILFWRGERRPPRSALGVPIVMAVLALTSHALGTTLLSDPNPNPGVDTVAQIAFARSHPWPVAKAVLPYAHRFLEAPSLGRTPLGWLDTVLEPSAIRVWTTLFWFAALSDALVLLAVLASARGSFASSLGRLTASRTFLASAFAIASYAFTGALIGLSMYLLFTPVGAPDVLGVQLRYYVPLFILFFALPGVLIHDLRGSSPTGPAPTGAQFGAGAIAAALAFVLICQTAYKILERYY